MEHPPYLNLAVATILKRIRAQSGYSQEQFAGFSRTSRSQIAQLEAGKRGVTLGSLFWISESINIPFIELVTMIDDEQKRLAKGK